MATSPTRTRCTSPRFRSTPSSSRSFGSATSFPAAERFLLKYEGVLGAALAVGLCYGVFAVLMTWVKPMGELFLDFSLFQFLPLSVIAGMLLGGALLGGLGSLFSLRRTTSPA